MSRRRPGDPYEVGFAKPPEKTRFKKGASGNPRGRPPQKPDPYTELMTVLREKVTVTIDGAPQKVTIQHALLLRLRQEALSGKIWAQKLVDRILAAMPEEQQPFAYELSSYESQLQLESAFKHLKGPEADNNDGR